MSVSKEDFTALGTIDPEKSSEIEIRNGIRSLYYGAYHQALELKNSIPGHSSGRPRTGSHNSLIGFYEDYPLLNPPVTIELAYKLKAYGALLEQLKDKRILADYELEKDIRKQDYELHTRNLEKAQGLFETILKLKSELA